MRKCEWENKNGKRTHYSGSFCSAHGVTFLSLLLFSSAVTKCYYHDYVLFFQLFHVLFSLNFHFSLARLMKNFLSQFSLMNFGFLFSLTDVKMHFVCFSSSWSYIMYLDRKENVLFISLLLFEETFNLIFHPSSHVFAPHKK